MHKFYLTLIFIFIFVTVVVFAQDSIGDGMYDDHYHLISQTGCIYQDVASVNYYEMTRLVCTAGDTISFRIYGNEFAMWAARGITGGDVEVCIDLTCSTASAYSPSAAFGEWVRFYGLSIDFHDIVLTVQTGTLTFDALWVAPVPVGGGGSEIHQFTVNVIIAEATPEVTPELTPEATEPPETASDYIEFDDDYARFDYSMTAGDVIISGLVMIVITLFLFGIGIVLWKK